jgi:hypothetical protein
LYLKIGLDFFFARPEKKLLSETGLAEIESMNRKVKNRVPKPFPKPKRKSVNRKPEQILFSS